MSWIFDFGMKRSYRHVAKLGPFSIDLLSTRLAVLGHRRVKIP